MKRTLILVALLLAAAGVSAQQYKWTDSKGRVQYGDVPPPGAKATALKGSSGGAAPAPSSLSEQEAGFRKRREEAQKARETQAKVEQEAREKKDNCANAQAAARTLASGQRIAATNAQGERYFLGEAEIAKESARVRQQVQEWCD
jgi:uncharacterized iron-regulated membrane protein